LASTSAHWQTLHFTVDAALLRELGERLIGQPQIALAELVKNSYDADASTCRIVFGDDYIEVIDDGHGMTSDEFKRFWMRIGSTHKVDASRSRNLHRPVTGSKGVGRLAVQFLARRMELETSSEYDPSRMLRAVADWTSIINGEDLESVEVRFDDSLPTPPDHYLNGKTSGTKIRLLDLRDKWTAQNIEGLGQAIWVLRSPFRQRDPMPSTRGPEDFDVEIEAPKIEDAKLALDKMLDALFANWKARIRGYLENGRRTGEAFVMVEFKQGYPDGQPREIFRDWVKVPVKPSDESGVFPLIDHVEFEILVFKLERRQTAGIRLEDLRGYLEKFGNVSIYDSGFRLPYYGAEQDWLEIARDHARRLSTSELLPPQLEINQRYMLDLPEARRIMGAVDLSTNHEQRMGSTLGADPSDILQLSPGRDRLHDNRAHRQLRDLVRYSLDYYANRYATRNARSVDRRRDSEPASAKQERALEILARNAESIPSRVYQEVRREVRDALEVARSEEEELDRRAALLAPLASAGMVALALNHELAREQRLLGNAVSQLRRIATEYQLPRLNEVAAEFQEATRRLGSIQELFAPLLSSEDREATHRLRVRPIVEQVVRSVEPIMGGLNFDLSKLPSDLYFPIGAWAEWSALIQNAVTNSWNATLSAAHPLVAFEGGYNGSREWLRVNDTGSGLGIPLDQANKLFDPFERRLELRSDLSSIAIGGHGLGLTIVRMIARRRGVDVGFIQPSHGFSTTLELNWKGQSR